MRQNSDPLDAITQNQTTALFNSKLINSTTSSTLTTTAGGTEAPTYSEAVKILSSLPFTSRIISHDNLESDSLDVVCQFFPHWNRSDLVITRCTDGITNKLLKITNKTMGDVVLIRCYGHGTSTIIDRHNELISIVTLSKLNFAPPMYGRFENGFCYGYTHGRVLTPEDLCTLEMAPLIAKKLAKWHKIKFPVEVEGQTKKAAIWSTMKNWLGQVPSKYSNQTSQKKFAEHEFLGKSRILAELAFLESDIAATSKSPIVFCHNDLLAANIIYVSPATATTTSNLIRTKAQDDKGIITPTPPAKSDEKGSDLPHIDSSASLHGGEAWFIDYEYGSYAYAAYDIANHFNEYAGFECDYTRFPTPDFQMKWIETYMSEYLGRIPSEGEVQSVFDDVQKFSLISHFFWAIWALVQENLSDIDFDYMGYAIMRFQEYYRRKGKVFPSAAEL